MPHLTGGSNTPNVANVGEYFDLIVRTPGGGADGTPIAGGNSNAGAAVMLSENDTGEVTGNRNVQSPETDFDYRLRVANDVHLDAELFNYAAQNTGKHTYSPATMVAAWTVNGLTTNSGAITTTTTGLTLGTYAEFPILPAGTTYAEFIGSTSAAATTNTVIDIGLFRRGPSNPYAPLDGVYFRFNASGWHGVSNSNGTEVVVGPFTTYPAAGEYAKFTISISQRDIIFWINDVAVGVIETDLALAQPLLGSTVPFSVRHAIVGGAASAAQSFLMRSYGVSYGGQSMADPLSTMITRCVGSHQGLSGGTLGSLASYGNSADPSAAASLSNTSALMAGLGGQCRFVAAVTGTTDGIVTSYLVPAGTTAVPGRRLCVRGVKISAANLGAAVATTATTIAWSLAFGHTSVSLATAEAGAAKAPRRVALGIQTWPVAAGIGAMPQNGDLYMPFQTPIYVNPGEYIATVAKFIVGTATGSQVIWALVTFDYGWE